VHDCSRCLLAASRPSTGPALSSLSVTDLPTPTSGSQPASRAAAIFARAHLAAAVRGPVRSRARLGDPAAALDLTPRGLDGQGEICGRRADGVAQRCTRHAAPQPQAQELPTVALLL
jgi:hypothetical protein